MHIRSDEELETAIRHMGLRPERARSDDSEIMAQIASPLLRLRFGRVSVLAGRAAGRALDLVDPAHPATSLLAASLPAGWRGDGQCWIFIPDDDGACAREQPTRRREFFKMMVLLIDLFDASHFFWSPARLWSDAPQFRASIAEMLTSGMPPVLHLVAFRRHEAEGAAYVGTRGLELFAGQELEGRIPEGWTVGDMVKRLARLSLDMMLNGPIREARRIRGLDAGEWVYLSPPPAGEGGRAHIRVEFGGDR
ncbi:hypothetical protein FHR22_000842 [Sphingopyxis panaciterrae]|uniref:hypothetical protein n=1 Tax=Sphingopyxis panaciterrae TaxID=363841 RepID=UPI00142268EB|nr:hypothetical protein [Sphingopyxis panaciterrae]NIJ36193.1 hypothetical protein [Sphingopyxis panaciterrae]